MKFNKKVSKITQSVLDETAMRMAKELLMQPMKFINMQKKAQRGRPRIHDYKEVIKAKRKYKSNSRTAIVLGIPRSTVRDIIKKANYGTKENPN